MRRVGRQIGAEYRSGKATRKLQSNPQSAHELLPKLVHRCWYVNMDQILDWEQKIKSLPPKFRIGGFANVNHWVLLNDNEALLVVVAEYSVLTSSLSPRVSAVGELFNFNAHIRPNASTGNYEMRTTSPDGQEEKNVMSSFGRKFFEMIKATNSDTVTMT